MNSIAAALLSFTATLASHSASHAADQPKAVVEMFTSQGCSSCPAADKVLGDYAKENSVLALSWHVDYWNYLGWKDTFSKAEFTQRQQRYAAAFKRRGVYTPQAVVNGRHHVVGSRRGQIENLIDTYSSAGKGLSVPLSVDKSGNQIRVSSAENKDTGEATLYIVYFNKEATVKIRKGENRGKNITYHNVVRAVSMLGMTKSGKVDVTLPLKEMKRHGFDACALILQQSAGNGLPGPIIGATVVDNLLDS